MACGSDCFPACCRGASESCYSGPAGTEDVGVCRAGNRQCQDDGTWGACTGEVTQSDETCDGLDNDCDGTVDNGDLCPTNDPSTCGHNGLCSGGSCQRYGNETICRPASCENGIQTFEARCDGAGSCPAPQQQTCPNGACFDGVSCGPCGNDHDCGAGRWCNSGTCQQTQDTGTACSEATPQQCASGICVGDTCRQSCVRSSDCPTIPPSGVHAACQDGYCHLSTGGCSNLDACSGHEGCTEAVTCLCDDPWTGITCSDLPVQACSDFTTCDVCNTHLADGCTWCSDTLDGVGAGQAVCTTVDNCASQVACPAPQPNGATCDTGSPDQCQSGFCVDGVCCESACTAPNHGSVSCAGGACVVTCDPVYTLCNGACVDTLTDNSNCSACGTVCPANQRCFVGICEPPCSGSQCPSGSACASSDNYCHPGACDCSGFNSCSGHGICSGSCTCECSDGWTGASCDTPDLEPTCGTYTTCEECKSHLFGQQCTWCLDNGPSGVCVRNDMCGLPAETCPAP